MQRGKNNSLWMIWICSGKYDWAELREDGENGLWISRWQILHFIAEWRILLGNLHLAWGIFIDIISNYYIGHVP